ncbi:nitroreductase/quinone reductase family protein [Nocardia sp. NPDC003979]
MSVPSAAASRAGTASRIAGSTFWMVSDHGRDSAYVRNIDADPRVRLQLRSRWYTGTARPLPDDDARARLRQLPRINSAMVRLLGTNLLTIRIDLDSTGEPDR